MKIKVIDMLVKMGKDENYKPTFKYKDTIYQYDFKTKYYTPSFMGLYKIYMILNDEVEILEETKKIEKIEETVSKEPERKEEKIISLKTNYRDSDE